MKITIEQLKKAADTLQMKDNHRNIKIALRKLDEALELLGELTSATSPIGYYSESDLEVYQLLIEAMPHLKKARKILEVKTRTEGSVFD